MDRRLRVDPDLGWHRKRAKQLKRALAAGDASAARRFARSHPRFAGMAVADVLGADVSLADAQRVIAREHGLASWAELKAAVERLRGVGPSDAHRLVHAIGCGDEHAVRELLARDRALASSADASGRTPLVAACERGDLALVELLLDAGADAKSGEAILAAAHAGPYRSGPALDVIARLIERGAPYDLFVVAALGRVEELRSALARADVDARGPGDATPLFLAAWNGHLDAVRLLLEAGADPEALCGGVSVWQKVSKHLFSEPHRAVARALLDHGARCTFREACVLGHAPSVDRLLESDPGAIDRPGPDGKTPLELAVLNADVALARRLLDAGAHDASGRARALARATARTGEDASGRLYRGSSFARSLFHDCSFAATTFSNVDLAGAWFENVNLRDARIANANVSGMTVFGIEIEPLLRKELERKAARPEADGDPSAESDDDA